MKTRFLVTLFALAGAACCGIATAQTTAADAVPQSAHSFVMAMTITTALNSEPRAGSAPYTPPCTRSTFTELGHGHEDVASAGYATAYCPSYGQTADAGSASRL
jgi:hypothetical protein